MARGDEHDRREVPRADGPVGIRPVEDGEGDAGGGHAGGGVGVRVVVRVGEAGGAGSEGGVEAEGLDAEELEDEEDGVGEGAGEAEQPKRDGGREGLCNEACGWERVSEECSGGGARMLYSPDA